jgi:hypothetical protein
VEFGKFKGFNNFNLNVKYTQDEKIYVDALAHVCNTEQHSIQVHREDFLNTLDKISLQMNETIISSSFNAYSILPEKLLLRTLTHDGYCYTFNMLGYHSLFNKNISKDFDVYKRKSISRNFYPGTMNSKWNFFDDDVDKYDNWTLSAGYLSNDFLCIQQEQ